jgi:predicted PurR-regulated permease PerM
MAEERFSKNFFLGLLFVLLILTGFVLYPLINALLCAGVLAYFFYPIYKWCAKKTHTKKVAAIFLVLILIVLISVAGYYITDSITKEGYTLFIEIKQKLVTMENINVDCAKTPYLFCGVMSELSNGLKNPQVSSYVETASTDLSSFIVNEASNFILNLPNLLIFFIVMFFSTYYFFVDGAAMIQKLKNSIPLKKHHFDDIINQFNEFMHATLLPVIGSPLVWIPTAITLLLAGSTGKAIILLLVGTFVISMADNYLRPVLIGNKSNIHPGIILIGTLGGILLMGPVGIIIGPLVLSLSWTFIEVYYKEGFGTGN